jgi:alanine racemase
MTVQVGDDVVLMGRDGAKKFPALNWRKKPGTITWEIVTRIGAAVRSGLCLTIVEPLKR